MIIKTKKLCGDEKSLKLNNKNYKIYFYICTYFYITPIWSFTSPDFILFLRGLKLRGYVLRVTVPYWPHSDCTFVGIDAEAEFVQE